MSERLPSTGAIDSNWQFAQAALSVGLRPNGEDHPLRGGDRTKNSVSRYLDPNASKEDRQVIAKKVFDELDLAQPNIPLAKLYIARRGFAENRENTYAKEVRGASIDDAIEIILTTIKGKEAGLLTQEDKANLETLAIESFYVQASDETVTAVKSDLNEFLLDTAVNSGTKELLAESAYTLFASCSPVERARLPRSFVHLASESIHAKPDAEKQSAGNPELVDSKAENEMRLNQRPKIVNACRNLRELVAYEQPLNASDPTQLAKQLTAMVAKCDSREKKYNQDVCVAYFGNVSGLIPVILTIDRKGKKIDINVIDNRTQVKQPDPANPSDWDNSLNSLILDRLKSLGNALDIACGETLYGFEHTVKSTKMKTVSTCNDIGTQLLQAVGIDLLTKINNHLASSGPLQTTDFEALLKQSQEKVVALAGIENNQSKFNKLGLVMTTLDAIAAGERAAPPKKLPKISLYKRFILSGFKLSFFLSLIGYYKTSSVTSKDESFRRHSYASVRPLRDIANISVTKKTVPNNLRKIAMGLLYTSGEEAFRKSFLEKTGYLVPTAKPDAKPVAKSNTSENKVQTNPLAPADKSAANPVAKSNINLEEMHVKQLALYIALSTVSKGSSDKAAELLDKFIEFQKGLPASLACRQPAHHEDMKDVVSVARQLAVADGIAFDILMPPVDNLPRSEFNKVRADVKNFFCVAHALDPEDRLRIDELLERAKQELKEVDEQNDPPGKPAGKKAIDNELANRSLVALDGRIYNPKVELGADDLIAINATGNGFFTKAEGSPYDAANKRLMKLAIWYKRVCNTTILKNRFPKDPLRYVQHTGTLGAHLASQKASRGVNEPVVSASKALFQEALLSGAENWETEKKKLILFELLYLECWGEKKHVLAEQVLPNIGKGDLERMLKSPPSGIVNMAKKLSIEINDEFKADARKWLSTSVLDSDNLLKILFKLEKHIVAIEEQHKELNEGLLDFQVKAEKGLDVSKHRAELLEKANALLPLGTAGTELRSILKRNFEAKLDDRISFLDELEKFFPTDSEFYKECVRRYDMRDGQSPAKEAKILRLPGLPKLPENFAKFITDYFPQIEDIYLNESSISEEEVRKFTTTLQAGLVGKTVISLPNFETALDKIFEKSSPHYTECLRCYKAQYSKPIMEGATTLNLEGLSKLAPELGELIAEFLPKVSDIYMQGSDISADELAKFEEALENRKRRQEVAPPILSTLPKRQQHNFSLAIVSAPRDEQEVNRVPLHASGVSDISNSEFILNTTRTLTATLGRVNELREFLRIGIEGFDRAFGMSSNHPDFKDTAPIDALPKKDRAKALSERLKHPLRLFQKVARQGEFGVVFQAADERGLVGSLDFGQVAAITSAILGAPISGGAAIALAFLRFRAAIGYGKKGVVMSSHSTAGGELFLGTSKTTTKDVAVGINTPKIRILSWDIFSFRKIHEVFRGLQIRFGRDGSVPNSGRLLEGDTEVGLRMAEVWKELARLATDPQCKDPLGRLLLKFPEMSAGMIGNAIDTKSFGTRLGFGSPSPASHADVQPTLNANAGYTTLTREQIEEQGRVKLLRRSTTYSVNAGAAVNLRMADSVGRIVGALGAAGLNAVDYGHSFTSNIVAIAGKVFDGSFSFTDFRSYDHFITALRRREDIGNISIRQKLVNMTLPDWKRPKLEISFLHKLANNQARTYYSKAFTGKEFDDLDLNTKQEVLKKVIGIIEEGLRQFKGITNKQSFFRMFSTIDPSAIEEINGLTATNDLFQANLKAREIADKKMPDQKEMANTGIKDKAQEEINKKIDADKEDMAKEEINNQIKADKEEIRKIIDKPASYNLARVGVVDNGFEIISIATPGPISVYGTASATASRFVNTV